MYQVKSKPQFVVEKMKEFRPKIVKKYFAAAGSPPPGGGNGDPFNNNNNFKKFMKFMNLIKTKQNVSNDIPQKLIENKKAIKFHKFTDVLKKDNIPEDVA
ncbi:MAG: hypothetical protein ACI4S3_06390, partial [Candidatus Gastranaerophilaceae bacterium]